MGDAGATATIMVVDDTPANLDLLAEMLHRQGFRVVQFPNGTLALRAASRNPPDLILLDIMMPDMSGFEVCRRLKSDEVLQAIPVIFISALDDEPSKLKAFSEGGVDYVTKPFHEEEVLARVRTHLSLCAMRRELQAQNLYLQDLVRAQVREISDLQLATILALSKLAEIRDYGTGLHIECTQSMCRALALELRGHPRFAQSINDAFVENIFHAAALHDIGKVGIPDNILLKPGRLTPSEYEIMKRHTVIGAMTLQSVRAQYPLNEFVNMGIAITRSHHERWDGAGYPDGLAGEKTPLSARIMALADVYSALRSERPYKKAFTHEESRQIILQGAGTHFDPAVVQAFCVLDREFKAIADGYFPRGEVERETLWFGEVSKCIEERC